MALKEEQVADLLKAYANLDAAIQNMRVAMPTQMTEREAILHAKQLYFRALFHHLMPQALTPEK